MQRHYRPRVNVVERPTLAGGRGISSPGHHEILLRCLRGRFWRVWTRGRGAACCALHMHPLHCRWYYASCRTTIRPARVTASVAARWGTSAVQALVQLAADARRQAGTERDTLYSADALVVGNAACVRRRRRFAGVTTGPGGHGYGGERGD